MTPSNGHHCHHFAGTGSNPRKGLTIKAIDKIVNKLVRIGQPERRFGGSGNRRMLKSVCLWSTSHSVSIWLKNFLKILKICNIWSESPNPITEKDRIRLTLRLTFIRVPKQSFSENFRPIYHELMVQSREKEETRKKEEEGTDRRTLWVRYELYFTSGMIL